MKVSVCMIYDSVCTILIEKCALHTEHSSFEDTNSWDHMHH